jgi:hypothetical protein
MHYVIEEPGDEKTIDRENTKPIVSPYIDGEDVPYWSTRWTFAKYEDGEWYPLGHFENTYSGPIGAIPCDEGRYILVSDSMAFSPWPDSSPFHVISFVEGSAKPRFGRSLDYVPDELMQFSDDTKIFNLPLGNSLPAFTDSHAVIVSQTTGLYWVLSLEKASLVKAGGIFKKVTPEMMDNRWSKNLPVLCLNPEKAGTFLVEAQDEDYFTRETGDYEKEYWELVLDKGMSLEEADGTMAPTREQWRKNSQHIVWYRIHPENGRAEKLHEPPQGGARLRDVNKNDVFRPMPAGSVKMGWDGTKLTEKLADWRAKADKKGDAVKVADKEAEDAVPHEDDTDHVKEQSKGNVQGG